MLEKKKHLEDVSLFFLDFSPFFFLVLTRNYGAQRRSPFHLSECVLQSSHPSTTRRNLNAGSQPLSSIHCSDSLTRGFCALFFFRNWVRDPHKPLAISGLPGRGLPIREGVFWRTVATLKRFNDDALVVDGVYASQEGRSLGEETKRSSGIRTPRVPHCTAESISAEQMQELGSTSEFWFGANWG